MKRYKIYYTWTWFGTSFNQPTTFEMRSIIYANSQDEAKQRIIEYMNTAIIKRIIELK